MAIFPLAAELQVVEAERAPVTLGETAFTREASEAAIGGHDSPTLVHERGPVGETIELRA
jgi:hypothetical protein